MDAEVERWIDALDGEPDARRQAHAALLALGSAAVDALCAVAEAGEGRKAWAALAVLGDLGDARAVPVIVKALRAPSPLVISAAVGALQKFPDEDVAMHLIEALPHTRGMGQQDMIVVLQRLGDARAVPLLIAQLGQVEAPPLRVAIIQALGKLGDRRAIPAIEAYRDDPDRHVRDWVASTLAAFDAAG